jgi:hypothetical protein
MCWQLGTEIHNHNQKQVTNSKAKLSMIVKKKKKNAEDFK